MRSGLRQIDYLRQAWKSSRVFKIILIAAAVYALLHLVLQFVVISGMMSGGDIIDSIPADLQIYLTAADHFANRQDLYLQGSLARLEDHYPYAPSFAMVFTPFLALPPDVAAYLHTLLHVVAYILLYFTTDRIFRKRGLEKGRELLAWSVPLWLIFAAFWSDIAYLNIYVIVTLLGALFIEAVLDQKLGLSILWLAIILQVKPHWAFAAALPLLLGNYRFFLKLVLFSIVAYAAIFAWVLIFGGAEYGLQQHAEYLEFLGRLSRDFPWRGPETGFMGYNHSITQIVVFALGVSSGAMTAATLVKIVLLLPLVVTCGRYLFRPAGSASSNWSGPGLDLAFALYLGVFIWLDMVWELTLGLVVFVYLLATLEDRRAKIVLWVVFLPYVLLDMWQVLNYLVFGEDAMIAGSYFVADPSIYLPMIMIVILVFYGLLLKRLWDALPSRAPAPADAALSGG